MFHTLRGWYVQWQFAHREKERLRLACAEQIRRDRLQAKQAMLDKRAATHK